MAIAKVILNGETLMDVTSDTATANNMLSGIKATKNDGTKVTGNIASKTSTDLTVSGATVTAPAGYYANAASKAVATTTHPNPTATITSSTGVVTASHTQGAGYVTAGTTTGTTQLTSQAAATIYPSTVDQTIASYRWLTGTQTIKSVTTSNLTAANIAEGVVVKVGDANNASRITQITGTHSGASSYTATIHESGNSSYCYVTYNGTKYYTNGNTFSFKAGETLTVYCRGNSVSLYMTPVTLSNYTYTYTLPTGDIDIYLTYDSSTSNSVQINYPIIPYGDFYVSNSGWYPIAEYDMLSVPAGSAFPPAVTITKAPTFSMNSSTGVITASYTGSSSITPTVTSGWVSQGTAGTISTTGTSTYTLTTQAAQTITPRSTSQTIASYRWLTGTQTITGDSNLIAENIAEGVSIFGVEGTHSGGDGFTADQIAMRTISGDISGNTSFIDSYAFYSCPNLTTVNFPAATSIGYGAFINCVSLTTISFPVATDIGSYAFSSCSNLTTVNFPMVTTIAFEAFINCISLTTISFPEATSIRSSAFSNCKSLTTISFPKVTYIGSYAFNSCSNLTTVSFPVCKSINAYTFARCTNLINANFPSCSSINSYAFFSCTNLTTVSFPICTTIGSNAFNSCHNLATVSFPSCMIISGAAFSSCYNLLSVYLLGSSVPSLAASTAFYSTPIGGYTTSTGGVYGSIFVPASLYNSYLTATNWSLFSARIVSV